MNRRPLRAAAFAAVVFLAALPAPTTANNLDDELRRVRDRIEELAGIIDDVTAARSDVAAEVEEAARELGAIEAELAVSEAELEAVQASVDAQRVELSGLSVKLREAYEDLSSTRVEIAAGQAEAIATARSAYISGGRDMATLSVSVSRISNIAIGMEYFARANGENRRSLATLEVLRVRADLQTAAIEADERLMVEELTRLEAEEATLAGVKSAQQDAAAKLEQAIAIHAHLLETLDEEIAHFETELDDLEREEVSIKRRVASHQKSTSSVAPAVAASGFVRPVPGPITSVFGPRYHPILGYSRMHNGVDFRAAHGDPIRAAQGGTIILANVWGGFGRTVVIDHGGGLSTLYAHQSSITVREGESVEAGQYIGRVGTSGLATGAHLHFEVRIGGDPVNPAPYLSG